MMRLLVFSDFQYARRDGALYAEEPVSLFLAGLAAHAEQVTLCGRLDERPGVRYRYRMPDAVGFAPLPHYAALSEPRAALRATTGAVRAFWRALAGADTVWLLGPHPLSLLFAALAAARRRRIAIGVRQDLPSYARRRHPGRRGVLVAAWALEGAYRLLSRAVGVVVVGDRLARHYAGARRLLDTTISLVPAAAVDAVPAGRAYDGDELVALSVGRLASEKNPLLLADVLAALRATDARWRLVVCGDGPLRAELEARLTQLGVAAYADVRGHVANGPDLRAAFDAAHAFLHVSWTEGMPQVLLEAFAARLPVVATDVGGVAGLAGDAVLLVPPGDAQAPARALERIAADEDLRARLVESGLERVEARTLEAETARVAAFLAGAAA